MNNITIELSEADRKLLTEIRDALQAGHDCKKCVDVVEATLDELAKPKTAPQTDETAENEQEPADPENVAGIERQDPERPVQEISLEQLQSKVVTLCAAGKKKDVREIIQAYSPNVSGIPADKRAEVWDKLTGLEG